jgi:prepilin-type processing-associated H-X9-DG protein
MTLKELSLVCRETFSLMTAEAPAVTDYELNGDLSALVVRTSRNDAFALAAERLRLACKCAHCSRARIDGRFPERFPGLAIVGVTDVGYGLNIAFSDGHARGIYPKSYLLGLASD